jgi:histidyl-tRNA synthetase
VEHAYAKRNPGKGLRDADRAGAVYAALRGSFEREQHSYQLKHLASGEQMLVAEADLLRFLEQHLQHSDTDTPPEQQAERGTP